MDDMFIVAGNVFKMMLPFCTGICALHVLHFGQYEAEVFSMLAGFAAGVHPPHPWPLP